ncbi:MAG TPA: DUF5522 domain-containing protein [Blastocatellia bacterium]|nr:DUF5522 domain-containing protein [Blastocatellia bacterium]
MSERGDVTGDIVRLLRRAVQYPSMDELTEGKDFYWEGAYVVFTAEYHLRKGQCCGSGCRHCPYEPRWTKGTTTPAAEYSTPPANTLSAPSVLPD